MSHQLKYLFEQQQLKNTIALFQTYSTSIQSNLISQSQIIQKGQKFIQWVNDLLTSKITIINQITQRSIIIFTQIIKEQLQISNKMVELQHQIAEKNILIENHLYTIKNIENKLIDRDNDLQKLKQQNIELLEKIEKQQSKFKRQAKQFKKTFRIIQENTESEKQIFDSIQLQYQYEKQQNQMLKEQIDTLKQEKITAKSQLQENKRLLLAAQNKVQYEIKKKIPLQQTINQQKSLIQKLLLEIQDLKDNLQNPYDGIDHDHLEEKQNHYGSFLGKDFEKNILSDQISLRQSFSQVDLDDFARKNSLRRSFDEPVGFHPTQNNMHNHPAQQIQETVQINIKAVQPPNERHHPLQSSPNSSIIKKVPNQSSNSILIKDMERTPVISPKAESQKLPSILQYSPRIHQFETSNTMPQKDENLDIISQKGQSQTSTLKPFHKYVPDLYFAHFLLTSQAVKIKQDCQEMLNIDVKPYYSEIISKRIPMHIWDDWVREKLRQNVKALKARRNNNFNKQSNQFK